jgi:hypothetical protein
MGAVNKQTGLQKKSNRVFCGNIPETKRPYYAIHGEGATYPNLTERGSALRILCTVGPKAAVL